MKNITVGQSMKGAEFIYALYKLLSRALYPVLGFPSSTTWSKMLKKNTLMD